MAINSRDVAKLAGVSQSTVSKVAHNNVSITLETRLRVIRAAKELGYALNTRKNKFRIAVIVPEQRFLGYVASMLSGISQEILGKGMGMEIIPDTRLSMLNERCIDGAIAISWGSEFYQEWSNTLPLPLVRINGPSNHINNCYSVCPDGMKSMQVLIDHFWKLGHRKIAFFFFNSHSHEIRNTARRLDGFLTAMRSHGMENPEQYCLFDCLRKECAELSQRLAAWHREGVTALIFANALGTGKMMQCIQLTKLKIPEDVSVVGWEQPFLSAYTVPALSTLSPEPKEFAKAAVTLLVRMMSHHAHPHDILLPYHWIDRESIGLAPEAPADPVSPSADS